MEEILRVLIYYCPPQGFLPGGEMARRHSSNSRVYIKENTYSWNIQSLPPQGFRPEAKSRGGTLVTRAYIKDSTYSSNIQSVY